MAGKNQANRLAAALTNWKEIGEVYNAALESEGSAEKENEKRLDSIQAKMNQLTASTQKWSHDLIDSGAVKFFVDLANSFVKLTDTIGPLNTVIGALAGYLSIKNNFGKRDKRFASSLTFQICRIQCVNLGY